MRRVLLGRFLLATCLIALWALSARTGDEPPRTGPQTEKRFPPLRVPDGFRATLFACDPLIEYPSAIAMGPRRASLFVAIDYLTGLGTDITRRDEIRLVEDTDGDGYADRATVFATGLNSVQGLAWHDGTLYVMHAPYLSALRDNRGTGKADERRDLLTGLGLAPENDQIRLHNANGVVVGPDGWLYLALGDHGCDVTRPEGDRLVLEGGGILRCRPDGCDLHVFATGLRNIYDIALDEELNVFVRDNENDGGDYKIRVCHSFFGADHGYPYLYDEHPDEALAPLADLGLGSSAGGVCYLATQFPAEYRGSLLFCEWGRAVVRYPRKRTGATFATPKESAFAVGAPDDPYGFKPTDLVVDRDGSLFISDWADGQRPRRGRGRIYQVRYVGKKAEPSREAPARLEDLVARLESESEWERSRAQEGIERRGTEGAAAIRAALEGKRLGPRGRARSVWALARVGGAAAVEYLFALAKADADAGVQVQAVRALADLTDPVLVRHRLDAGPGEAALAERFAALAAGREARVRLEVILALGRLRWRGAPAWLRKEIDPRDPALAHAALWNLRQAGDWPAVLKCLDEPDTDPFRAIARQAVAGRYDREVVDGLAERLGRESDPARRRACAGLLVRVHRKPATPWVYWGYRPPPRPANRVAWERTEAIERALDHVLANSDRTVRRDVLRLMIREKVPGRAVTLGPWLREERASDVVSDLLTALRDRPGAESRPHLEAVLQERHHTTTNRLLAAGLFLQGLDSGSEERLVAVACALEDGPVLAEFLRTIGLRKPAGAAPLLVRKLTATDAQVQACALAALAEVDGPGAREPVGKLLGDGNACVRAAAALAAGKLGLGSAADRLVQLVRDSDPEVRRSSLEALRRLRDPRLVTAALAALQNPETALKALECLGERGGPEQVGAVTNLARRHPSVEILAAAGRVLTGWRRRPGLSAAGRRELDAGLAAVHGSSGVLLSWHVQGPLLARDAHNLVARITAGRSLPNGEEPDKGWKAVLSGGTEARLGLGAVTSADDVWLACTEVAVTEATPVEFFTTSTGLCTVWLNDREAYRREQPVVRGPYPDRFEAALPKGSSRVLVRLTGAKETAEFQLRFRRRSATANHEQLTRLALSRAGNPEHGRQLFLDAEKSLCLKCHRVGDKGERVGPDLTGLGSRFSKVYIVESILEPSRTIAPSFETVVVTLKSGKVVSGIQVAQSETSITLTDNQAVRYVVARADVEEMHKGTVSTMPEGLEKRLTEDEFVDLLSFLANLKDPRGR
jgi:putative membrane-bound dehydrogenase-like protein